MHNIVRDIENDILAKPNRLHVLLIIHRAIVKPEGPNDPYGPTAEAVVDYKRIKVIVLGDIVDNNPRFIDQGDQFKVNLIRSK